MWGADSVDLVSMEGGTRVGVSIDFPADVSKVGEGRISGEMSSISAACSPAFLPVSSTEIN